MKATETAEMETAKKISKSELIEKLMTIKKGTFAFISMETKPAMNKGGREATNPYFEKVLKHTRGNIYIGGNYEKRVQKETGDSEFKAQENNVGSHISECVLYNEGRDTHYLEYEWFDEVAPKATYTFEGNPIEKALFESYLKNRTYNPNGVNCQSVKIDNIREINFKGERFIIE